MGTGHEFTIVDTPGFGDSDGQEQMLIDEMAKFLKNEVKSTNVFLILFHGQQDRIYSGLVRMLREIPLIFGDDFWNHAILGFTHWPFDKRSARIRKRKLVIAKIGTLLFTHLRVLLNFSEI